MIVKMLAMSLNQSHDECAKAENQVCQNEHNDGNEPGPDLVNLLGHVLYLIVTDCQSLLMLGDDKFMTAKPGPHVPISSTFIAST